MQMRTAPHVVPVLSESSGLELRNILKVNNLLLEGVYTRKSITKGKKKWKKTCCLPSFVICIFILFCITAGVILLAIFHVESKNMTINAILISIACAVGLAIIWNCRTWWQVMDSILNSQRKRLHNAASKLHKLKSEGFMKVLKCEVELMAKMAKTIDGFTQNQTRLVVIIDGLDACEQDKVLQMLDTVRILFSKGPFIAIFASDPHIIIKAINQNLNSVLRDSNINGHDYMRNIVHLPVFLNSRGLSSAKNMLTSAISNGDVPYSETTGGHEDVDRRVSQHSLADANKLGSKTALNRRTCSLFHMTELRTKVLSGLRERSWYDHASYGIKYPLAYMIRISQVTLEFHKLIKKFLCDLQWANNSKATSFLHYKQREAEQKDTYRRRQIHRTITRQMSFDLTKMLVTEDWFSDISPQTMRRLLNIVSVTGRLLRANQISFNWDRLASWINLTEQWPYRTSWIILYLEETEGVPDQSTLKTIYERISKNIPTTKDVEPLLEIDGDIRNFEVFLSSRTPVLVSRDVKIFLPCTVNLDPKLREIISDVRAARDQMNIGGLPYPTLPLQEAPQRATSVLSQPSSVCSPSASYNGPFHTGVVSPPQPPSSYYSGMTGPQHPFYNRPFFAPHVYVPKYYFGQSQHAMSRPSVKTGLPRDQNSGLSTSGGPLAAPLNSMNVDAVCEKLKQIEGLDQSMLAQYTATIRKANINGRVLVQCNTDELKKELHMNFGDWHLFKSVLLEMRSMEAPGLPEDSRAVGEHGRTAAVPTEATRRPPASSELPHTDISGQPYDLSFSFEDLNAIGLEEGPRHSNISWQGPTHRTPSLSSLNSQDSTNDISKLTDKVQAEYRDAYREYIAQMAQIEGGGTSSTTLSGRSSPSSTGPYCMGQSTSGGSLYSSTDQDKGKDGDQKQEDGRKSFLLKRSDMVDYSSSGVSTADASPLDPITEEDEKSDQSGSKLFLGKKSSERANVFQGADLKPKGPGLRYQKLPSDEDESGTEESDNTPLLKEGKNRKTGEKVDRQGKITDQGPESVRALIKAKEYLSDAMLDKKDSSDSGVRSNESSPNHSLHNEEVDDSQLEKSNLLQQGEDALSGRRGIPQSLSGLQDSSLARMSICSEDKKSPSESSLIASSPEENWPDCQKAYNLNRTPSTVTLNNNSAPANRANQHFEELEDSPVIIHPGSSSNGIPVQNENLRGVAQKRGNRFNKRAKDASELHTVGASETAGFGEERESIL